MNENQVTLPTIALIAGTRVALGLGVGLLLADRLSAEERRSAGWALVGFGALSTIPLLMEVFNATGPTSSTRQNLAVNAGIRQGVSA